MKPHLQYLSYVVRHKWFVFRAGLKTKAPLWRLLIHDWSKFTPAEWFPYVRSFYGKQGRTPAVRAAFDRAWLHHQHRNPHHWQHWLEIGPVRCPLWDSDGSGHSLSSSSVSGAEKIGPSASSHSAMGTHDRSAGSTGTNGSVKSALPILSVTGAITATPTGVTQRLSARSPGAKLASFASVFSFTMAARVSAAARTITSSWRSITSTEVGRKSAHQDEPERSSCAGSSTRAFRRASASSATTATRLSGSTATALTLPCALLREDDGSLRCLTCGREDDGNLKTLDMPTKLVCEMVADWMGAGRAITGSWEVGSWFDANAHKIKLHPDTLIQVENLIDEMRDRGMA